MYIEIVPRPVGDWIVSSLREMMMNTGVVASRKSLTAEDPEGKFKIYYEYREPAKTIPSHRMLAIRRGENENAFLGGFRLWDPDWLSHLQDPRGGPP